MQSKPKQEDKPKAYQVILQPDDSALFDQLAKRQGLAAASYLRMLVKREIEQTAPPTPSI